MKNLTSSPSPTSWLEIDLAVFRENYRSLRNSLPSGTGVMAVVKADAYGHGLIPISRELGKLKVPALAVGSAEEGIMVRKALGPQVPIILLLGVTPEEAPLCLRYRLTPVVYSLESARALHHAALREKTVVPVHLKVDTGMGRLGVPWNELPQFLEKTKKWKGLWIKGLTSHFGQADERERPYNHLQWSRYEEALALARERGLTLTENHMANSAALLHLPRSRLDFVRPGILLYGCRPAVGPRWKGTPQVRPIMSLKSRILQVKRLPAGVQVSYGGLYQTRRPTTVAVIPVGYANGYLRSLSNKGAVLIRGRRFPVIGRVCMNLIVVRLASNLGVKAGEEVVLMGSQGKQAVTPDELALKAGTISYELFCLMGQTNPRFYVH